jgi:hypothetical protein
MSFDLFMNDTCLKCHKPLNSAAIGPDPTRRDLAVHKFVYASCGTVKTKILLRKKGKPLLMSWQPRASKRRHLSSRQLKEPILPSDHYAFDHGMSLCLEDQKAPAPPAPQSPALGLFFGAPSWRSR